jgi:hypothetical protein
MDGSRFDRLAQAWGAVRSRRALLPVLGGALLAPVATGPGVNATIRKRRKHNRKCANTCKNGCCTSKYGKCVRPKQQTAELCGTGGERCRRTGCGTQPETCADHTCSATTPCPTGECCSADGTCCACLAFVTSTTHIGNLGGLAGADTICQGAAGSAGLPGTYLAWLSDPTGSPSTRFTQATVPYTLVNGTVIANNWSDLTSGTLRHAIDRTEAGGDGTEPNAHVWSNTFTDGTADSSATRRHCLNWSNATLLELGNVGLSDEVDEFWTNFNNSVSCNADLRLYCFQQQ